MIITSDSANKSLYFYIVGDASHASPGDPITGLLFSDIETGGSASYVRQGAARVDLTLITLASASAAHSDGGFIEVDATNMPGVYRCDFPEATWATGVDQVICQLVAASANNAVVEPVIIDISDFELRDPVSAANFVMQYDETGLTGDTFPSTQQQVGRLTSGSAAINTVAGAFVKSGAEPETNDYTLTFQLDGVLHIVEDVANNTDAYYEFSVGGNGVPVEIVWDGYARSNGDSYALFAYNYSSSTYEQIGSVSGKNSTSIIRETFSLTNAHVGAGADLGKVRFRFQSSDGTHFATDRILCSYAIVVQSVGYDGGKVWVDTINGAAGTESFVNGTADNPSLTLADATIIAGNVGLSRFDVSTGSSITLAQDYSNAIAYVYGVEVDLNGKDLSDTHSYGGHFSGVMTGSGDIHFTESEIEDVTFPPVRLKHCAITGTITAGSAGTYSFAKCYSQVAGTTSPVFDFSNVGDIALNIRSYSGGLEVENMSAGDAMSFEGNGQLIINASCTGGMIVARGAFFVTDNSGGAVTITYDDNTSNIAAMPEATAAAVAAYDMGGGRTIEQALAFLRNKWKIVGGTLTVYDTDDVTVLWTSAMVQTAGDPVSSSDPA